MELNLSRSQQYFTRFESPQTKLNDIIIQSTKQNKELPDSDVESTESRDKKNQTWRSKMAARWPSAGWSSLSERRTESV